MGRRRSDGHAVTPHAVLKHRPSAVPLQYAGVSEFRVVISRSAPHFPRQRHLVIALASRLQECTVRIAASATVAEANALMGTARAQARMLAVILYPPSENFDASPSSALAQFVASHAVSDVDAVAEPIDLVQLINCARRASCSMAALPWLLDFLRCCRCAILFSCFLHLSSWFCSRHFVAPATLHFKLCVRYLAVWKHSLHLAVSNGSFGPSDFVIMSLLDDFFLDVGIDPLEILADAPPRRMQPSSTLVCSITGVPPLHPVICVVNGLVFDRDTVMRHVMAHGSCPVTDAAVKATDFVALAPSGFSMFGACDVPFDLRVPLHFEHFIVLTSPVLADVVRILRSDAAVAPVDSVSVSADGSGTPPATPRTPSAREKRRIAPMKVNTAPVIAAHARLLHHEVKYRVDKEVALVNLFNALQPALRKDAIKFVQDHLKALALPILTSPTDATVNSVVGECVMCCAAFALSEMESHFSKIAMNLLQSPVQSQAFVRAGMGLFAKLLGDQCSETFREHLRNIKNTVVKEAKSKSVVATSKSNQRSLDASLASVSTASAPAVSCSFERQRGAESAFHALPKIVLTLCHKRGTDVCDALYAAAEKAVQALESNQATVDDAANILIQTMLSAELTATLASIHNVVQEVRGTSILRLGLYINATRSTLDSATVTLLQTTLSQSKVIMPSTALPSASLLCALFLTVTNSLGQVCPRVHTVRFQKQWLERHCCRVGASSCVGILHRHAVGPPLQHILLLRDQHPFFAFL